MGWELLNPGLINKNNGAAKIVRPKPIAPCMADPIVTIISLIHINEKIISKLCFLTGLLQEFHSPDRSSGPHL